ncbi:hypothetical protein RND71_043357 [Anisodus tanguticus]|uniref:JmjC domain-containing protein n=1 Tax=Anisodus tanguticus TaxID=243964 RepID=A0AAE1QNR8_9SOLA|nr:hypothetical protein RND71_043357 [Anisodus tanguticus]
MDANLQGFICYTIIDLLTYNLSQHKVQLNQLKFNYIVSMINFKIYVDKIGFNECLAKPIEYLDDKQLDFVIYDELKKFEEISLDQERSTIENNNLRLCVNEWADFQKQQKVLLKTPSILMGYRVQVYRAIGTTQWFTAVIKSYDENTKELILTDDTVLEEHYEDPTLVQMKLIGDGVVQIILIHYKQLRKKLKKLILMILIFQMHVGDQLCDLINEELRAMKMHCGIDRSISWKRVVQGIREMCDVCETTLFNIHWTCHDCGFVLCIDCYGARLNCDGTPGDAVPPLSCDSSSNNGNDRDAYQWLLCQNDQPHEQSKLVMTQIVADRVLNDMAKKLHKIRSKLRINCNSICCKDGTSNLNGLFFSDEECDENLSTSSDQSQNHQIANSLNENMAASNLINSLINKPHNKENKNQLLNSSNVNNSLDLNSIKKANKSLVHLTPDDEKRKALEFFALKRDRKLLNANYMPSRCCKVEQTRRKYPEVPHSWLCEGRLLCLENSSLNDKNLDLFQEQWLRGQPLIITGIHEKLSSELWNPEQLSVKMTDFTCKGNGLYDCRTSNSVRIPLRRFWEGFENVNRRAKDSNGDPLILKLKDWPPGDDFCDLMPDHFSEFFNCIPLPIYTKREGKLNLAARLPDSFVRPDLGPKMYTAYGCDVNAPDVGTANLHLDVSDAVNVLVYVSVPKCKDDLQQKQLNFLLNLSDIDQITKKKIRDKDSKIGALWHIYEAKDADKIREFLKKVSAERGKPLAASMDPIHDQSWYLNKELRDRLKNEFNVNGYSIVQCLGDAVFIPAGSPHQLANELNVDHQKVVGCMMSIQTFPDVIDCKAKLTKKWQLSEEGNIVYQNGSHEYNIFKRIPDQGIDQKELLSKLENPAIGKLGFSKAMQNGWIKIDKNDGTSLVKKKIENVEDQIPKILEMIKQLKFEEVS